MTLDECMVLAYYNPRFAREIHAAVVSAEATLLCSTPTQRMVRTVLRELAAVMGSWPPDGVPMELQCLAIQLEALRST